jgi:peptidoglycan-N-acetylglucosamine deacetylase
MFRSRGQSDGLRRYKTIPILPGVLAVQAIAWALMGASYAQGLGVDHVRTTRKVIALTFDADMTPSMLKQLKDGRVASWYNKPVIEKLRELHVPATLFLTGLWVEAYPAVTKELSDDALFELGNHSYSHGGFRAPCHGLANTPEANKRAEVRRTDMLLRKYATSYRRFFRFPGLCFDADDVRTVQEEGYIVVGGDVYSGDGFETNAGKIVRTVLAHVHPGCIVVFHMHGGRNAPKRQPRLPPSCKS